MRNASTPVKTANPSVKSESRLLAILNHQLADTVDLRSQVRHAFLNVRGLYAHELRGLLDGVARDLRVFVDILGRRIAALGGSATATVRFAARESSLRDYPSHASDAHGHLEALLANCALYEKGLRRNMKAAREFGDPETAALFRVLSSSAENNIWFLNVYLEGVAVNLHTSKLPMWKSTFEDNLTDL